MAEPHIVDGLLSRSKRSAKAASLWRKQNDGEYMMKCAFQLLKEVLDCVLVAGDFDYLLKIRVRDMADFNKLHGDKLIALPGVRQTRTFFVMKEVKENARLSF